MDNEAQILVQQSKGARPVIEVLVPTGTTLETSQKLEAMVYERLMPELGLGSCQNCRSGLDMTIRERFDHVMRVDLATFEVRG